MIGQYEHVYTVTDFYDGPRQGIANFHGAPHAYRCIFDKEQDEYSDVYLLKPIEESVLELALEQWDIWLRWEAAFQRGGVDLSTHPALPQDRIVTTS